MDLDECWLDLGLTLSKSPWWPLSSWRKEFSNRVIFGEPWKNNTMSNTRYKLYFRIICFPETMIKKSTQLGYFNIVMVKYVLFKLTEALIPCFILEKSSTSLLCKGWSSVGASRLCSDSAPSRIWTCIARVFKINIRGSWHTVTNWYTTVFKSEQFLIHPVKKKLTWNDFIIYLFKK